MPVVVKHGRTSPVLPQALVEATGRAHALVAEAEARALAMCAEAEAQAEAMRAAAAGEAAAQREEARRLGREEGLAQLSASLAALVEVRERRLAAVEDELAKTALEVAAAVLGEELTLTPARATSLVRRALALARTRREVVVRCSPADAPALRGEGERLGAVLTRCPGLELREDPALGRGDVIVETEAGRVDARLATQLGAIEAALAGEAACAMG